MTKEEKVNKIIDNLIALGLVRFTDEEESVEINRPDDTEDTQ